MMRRATRVLHVLAVTGWCLAAACDDGSVVKVWLPEGCGGRDTATVPVTELPADVVLAPLVMASGSFEVAVRWRDGVEEDVAVTLVVDEEHAFRYRPKNAVQGCEDRWGARVAWQLTAPSGRVDASGVGAARFGDTLGVTAALPEPWASDVLAAVGAAAVPPVTLYFHSDGTGASIQIVAIQSATADVDVEIAASGLM